MRSDFVEIHTHEIEIAPQSLGRTLIGVVVKANAAISLASGSFAVVN